MVDALEKYDKKVEYHPERRVKKAFDEYVEDNLENY